MERVSSKRGFYVGDVCYVLSNDVYYGVWGNSGWKDGYVEVPGTDFGFAVSGTAYGDGAYCDGQGRIYGVDAGVIGLVPLELVGKKNGLENGGVFYGEGVAEFEEEDGVFVISLPDGQIVIIDTKGEDFEDDYEDSWDDEVGFDPYLGCYTDDV